MSIVTGATLRLPPEVGRRDFNVPEAARSAAFAAAYDRETLFYDAFATGRGVMLVGPSLRNLCPALKAAAIACDGIPSKIRKITSRRRSDEVLLSAPKDPKILSLKMDKFTADLSLSACEESTFAGLNCSVIFNKNNDPAWIGDFARFHKRHQDLEGLLVVDNGSDAYPLEAIASELDTAGLTAFRVLSIPAKWGGLAIGSHKNDALFFQTAALNIARMRFLSRARAVLVCDLDELVLPNTRGRNVFDLARRRFWGFTPIRGRNCYPVNGTEERRRHGDHRLRDPKQGLDSTKYCINPRGILRGVGWEIHKPDFVSVDKAMDHRDMEFAHCVAITNGWKRDGSIGHRELVEDPALSNAMADAFGETLPQ